MFKEKHIPTIKPQENTTAANDTKYGETKTLDSLSLGEIQSRKKALIWLLKECTGQNEIQRVAYQAELDRINNFLEQ